ncbi:MATE family efflux transporter [Kordiimonas pumila]|uniref:MATE family efflux transporter n=1 Tax=Kordiimonas pumila TaxID=2161677 RepID=A0ABV7D9R3_9PROT|nr:MATE family efflux transporter [Kordiimonas pumila]
MLKISANRKIWAIAGPAIIANSSAPLVGLVDTWVIGHLPGPVPLATIGVGATIFSFLFWAFGFLRMSTTGMIAQAFGRNDTDEMARVIVRATSLGFSIALLLLCLQEGILFAALKALNPPEATLDGISQYFSIRIWAAPATLFIYGVTGFLIGTARTGIALILQLILNLSNAALNLILVIGFDMGVSGIAIGSLCAEWIAAFYGVWIISSRLGHQNIVALARQNQTWKFDRIKALLSSNGYIFARTLLLMASLALVTKKAAELGTAELAASQVLFTFLLLISLGLDAFAYAAEALSGAAYGKKSLAEFRFWVRRTSVWAFAISVFYAAGFFYFGNAIVNTLTDIVPVRTAAASVMPLIAVLPLLSVWCYQFDGIFIGATASRGMLITMAGAACIYVAIINGLTAAWGLTGLWGALTVFMAARGLGQLLYYPVLEKRITEPAP